MIARLAPLAVVAAMSGKGSGANGGDSSGEGGGGKDTSGSGTGGKGSSGGGK